MDYLIGLDIGTSSVKAALMPVFGKLKMCKTKKHTYYNKDGFKTLDADEFCEGCFEVIKELTSQLDDNDKVLGVCASGASGNLLFVKDGRAVSPVYGWQIKFDEEITDKVLGAFEPDFIYNAVGWPRNHGFPLDGLAYFKGTNPSVIEDADMICMHIEYFNFLLTGKWGITPSMGTPFYMINQEEIKYEQKFLDVLGIDELKLPPIMEHCSKLGEITEFASEKTGLKTGTPVILGTFDHPSAARGAGVFDEGEVLISCGTSWVVFVPLSKREDAISKRMLSDPFMYPKGNCSGMKSLTSVSDTIDKYMKKYLGDISFEELDRLSDKAPIGANGLLIDDDTDISGYEKTDIARAIMESIALRLNEFLKEYAKDCRTIRLVGGITKSKVWSRVISEITGKTVEIINGEHAGAVGSAIMAGVGTGIYESEKQAFNAIYREEK